VDFGGDGQVRGESIVPGRDLIVVGGSAGGIEALSALIKGLPADLPAAVCVAVHMAPYFDSRLPEVLAHQTTLNVRAAEDGAPIRPGTVYVCVPDMHLMVQRNGTGVIRLTRGPKEHRTRPAVDPLFRSAALAFGPRVIGVILSGALDDGTAGLWAVRDCGGVAVVQDPRDAAVHSMPTSAINEVGADHVVAARDMGPLLTQLVDERVAVPGRGALSIQNGEAPAGADDHAAQPRHVSHSGESRGDLEREVAISLMDDNAQARSERYGQPSRFACPDCGGVLWDVASGRGPARFRCETGHAYAPGSLAEAETDSIENALWASLRALEDKIELSRMRAESAERRGLAVYAEAFKVQVQAALEHAAAVRALLRLDGREGIRPLP
jgi:two-component system, chemotaxis family, protein-glutamate methylesterase/glutaminase